jgi:hypothetical protein
VRERFCSCFGEIFQVRDRAAPLADAPAARATLRLQ